MRGVDRSRQARKKCRQCEDPKLVAKPADASRNGVSRVVAERPEGQAKWPANDDVREGKCESQHEQCKEVVRYNVFGAQPVAKAQIAKPAYSSDAAKERHASAFVGRKAF